MVSLKGDVPALDSWFPMGGQRGQSVEVTLDGKLDPWPPGFHTTHPGVRFEADPKKKGRVRVHLEGDLSPGPFLFRLHNAEGASPLYHFLVGERSEKEEPADNDEFRHPPELKGFPFVLNGRLEKSGDTDHFGIRLEESQTLVAELDAYRIDSPVDALFHIRDASGTRLAFQHDGRRLDPSLAFRAPADGLYVLQVAGFAYPPKSDIRLTGSAATIYRLGLEVQTGKSEKMGGLEVPQGDYPGIVEIEPNDELSTAQPVEWPVGISGRLKPEVHEKDLFSFRPVAGRTYEFAARSARPGFALRAVIRLLDEKGKQLAAVDDATRTDPVLNWKATDAERKVVVLADKAGQRNDRLVYHLTIREVRPGIRASLPGTEFVLKGGEELKIPVTVERLAGFSEPLVVRAVDLPEGIEASPATIAKGEG
ncbi:MAG: hypothetical protein AAF514_24305, partial [Verrucomicrobiota bacterium]